MQTHSHDPVQTQVVGQTTVVPIQTRVVPAEEEENSGRYHLMQNRGVVLVEIILRIICKVSHV